MFHHYPQGLRPEDTLHHYAPSDRLTAWFRAMMITSLDGAATLSGRSGGLGDSDDQLIFTTTRAVADAIVVGAGTVRAEGYDGARLPQWATQWRQDHNLPERPALVILSRSGNIPWEQFQAGPIIIVSQTPGQIPPSASGVVTGWHTIADITDFTQITKLLHSLGYLQLVAEGGPTVLASAHRSGVIDELCLSLSPHIVGGQSKRILQDQLPGEVVVEYELQQILLGKKVLFLRYA